MIELKMKILLEQIDVLPKAAAPMPTFDTSMSVPSTFL